MAIIIVAQKNTTLNLGPFARHYFLDPENTLNLFAEGGYILGQIRGKGYDETQKSNTYAISAGPVLYFNSAVGLEFIFSYSATKFAGFPGVNWGLGIGPDTFRKRSTILDKL